MQADGGWFRWTRLARAPKPLRGAVKSRRLAALFRDLAAEFGTGFLDAATVAAVSAQNGVHPTPEGHIALAEAMAAKLRQDFTPTGC